jgi:spore maturation protein CgeB
VARADNPIANAFAARPRSGTAVLVGEFFTAAPFPHFAAAMRAEGWDVQEVEFGNYVGSPGNKWVHRIADRLLPRAKGDALAAAVLAAAASSGADIVLFAKGIGATPALIAQLAARGCRAICWYPDYHFDYPNVDQACFPLFDLFITTKEFQLAHLRALRGDRPTILIEHGWSPGVHWRIDPPLAPETRPFDVIFIGNHSPHKEEWMRALVTRLPLLRVAICGHRWPHALSGFPPDTTVAGPLTGDSMSRAIGHARIAIAVHHGPGGQHGWQDEVSARTFEIPACGTFMLHIDSAHVRTLFDVPGEIDVFADADALAAKVAHYLAHPAAREAAAARAHVRAVPAYSYFEAGRAISAAVLTHLGPDARKRQQT